MFEYSFKSLWGCQLTNQITMRSSSWPLFVSIQCSELGKLVTLALIVFVAGVLWGKNNRGDAGFRNKGTPRESGFFRNLKRDTTTAGYTEAKNVFAKVSQKVIETSSLNWKSDAKFKKVPIIFLPKDFDKLEKNSKKLVSRFLRRWCFYRQHYREYSKSDLLENMALCPFPMSLWWHSR